MTNLIIVFIGAGIGGVLRFLTNNFVTKLIVTEFPIATLLVNVVGSFVIGYVMFHLDNNKMISPEMRLLLTTGFCGGLTTFSTFSFETFNLIRAGNYLFAGVNLLANLILTLLAVFLAYQVSKVL